jgi:hypothetical protein
MRTLNPLASCGRSKSASLKGEPYRTSVGQQRRLIGSVPGVSAPFTRAALGKRHIIPYPCERSADRSGRTALTYVRELLDVTPAVDHHLFTAHPVCALIRS